MVEQDKFGALQVLIRNETQKLTANFLNAVGVAAIGVGVLPPTINAISIEPKTLNILAILGWFVLGVIFHLFARSFIADMEES